MADFDLRRRHRNNLARRFNVMVFQVDQADVTSDPNDRYKLATLERDVVLMAPVMIITRTPSAGVTAALYTDSWSLGAYSLATTATETMYNIPNGQDGSVGALVRGGNSIWLDFDSQLDADIIIVLPYIEYERAEDHYVGSEPV